MQKNRFPNCSARSDPITPHQIDQNMSQLQQCWLLTGTQRLLSFHGTMSGLRWPESTDPSPSSWGIPCQRHLLPPWYQENTGLQRPQAVLAVWCCLESSQVLVHYWAPSFPHPCWSVLYLCYYRPSMISLSWWAAGWALAQAACSYNSFNTLLYHPTALPQLQGYLHACLWKEWSVTSIVYESNCQRSSWCQHAGVCWWGGKEWVYTIMEVWVVAQDCLLCSSEAVCPWVAVKSGSTPVGGPVKSGWRQMKEEGRGLGKKLVQLELVTAWIQQQGWCALIPCIGSSQEVGDGNRDRDRDRQELE